MAQFEFATRNATAPANAIPASGHASGTSSLHTMHDMPAPLFASDFGDVQLRCGSANGVLQRQCARTNVDNECEEYGGRKFGLQRKLTIGATDDPLEREADRVADQVMAMPAHAPGGSAPPPIRRAAAAGLATGNTAPPSVERVLAGPGRPLDQPLREDVEQRFGYDFSRVRVHTDRAAQQSARDVDAHAYTVGRDIVFGAGQYCPHSRAGMRLLSHELAHVVQQTRGAGGRPWPSPAAGGQLVARQTKADDETATEDDQTTEPLVKAGTPVSKIIIDLRRGRVGFAVPAPIGFILGSVSTDLKPGVYQVTPDFKKQQWIFRGGQVKPGLRFHVELEGADPWALSYPEQVPVMVGFSTERKGGGPTGDTPADQEADMLRIWDEAPAGNIPEDTSIDGFVDFTYVPETVEGTGKFTPFVTLKYLDGSEEVINIDDIGEGTDKPDAAAQQQQTASGRTRPGKLNCATTPNLCSMKKAVKRTQELLLKKWDAELLNEEFKSFPQVFAVIAQVGVMGANARTFEITGKPANSRGTLPRAASGAAAKIKPVNGVVNVGGGLEEGATQATNLNPIKPGTGGPTQGIPNHVKAGFEDIDQVFEPGSVEKIISRKLTSRTVDWNRSAQAAAKVMAPGGKVRLNVWQHGTEDSAVIKEAFEKAGFKNVKVVGEGSTVVLADW